MVTKLRPGEQTMTLASTIFMESQFWLESARAYARSTLLFARSTARDDRPFERRSRASVAFLRQVSARPEQVFVHRRSRALDIPRPYLQINASMHVGRVLEIAIGRSLRCFTALFIEEARNHVHERRDDRIARCRRDDAMKVDVVHQEHLRFVERGQEAGDRLLERGELVCGRALGGETRCLDLENTARFVHLLVRDAMERSEKTERLAAKRRRPRRNESAGAVTRLHHTHGREGMQPGADGWPADADLRREVSLGRKPIAGLEHAALNERADVRDHVLGAPLGYEAQRLLARRRIGHRWILP